MALCCCRRREVRRDESRLPSAIRWLSREEPCRSHNPGRTRPAHRGVTAGPPSAPERLMPSLSASRSPPTGD
jgi:hypothetical protein